MTDKCMFCSARIKNKVKKMCYKCQHKGPYGQDFLPASLICHGTTIKGEPCRNWAYENNRCGLHKYEVKK